MKNIKQALYAVTATVLVAAPFMVGAQTGIPAAGTIATPDSTGFNVSKATTSTTGLANKSVYSIIGTFMNWLLGLVGVLAVIAFVISGILYLTAAGNEEQVEKAKGIMTYAIIGLVVALLGLVIVNAVAGLTSAGGATSF
ncbi:MAG: pilin [Candidatus Moranbacteria bacterium]|nr:pilin [Candidatus Moranbacteria bacterium]